MPNYSESIPEILTRVHKAKDKAAKKKILLENDTKFLQTILQGAFHPDIVWELPEGPVPYKKDPGEYGLNPSVLEKELRKITYFTNYGGNQVIENVSKRQDVFIGMLEAIHPSEAELLIAMKDKKLNYKGLTYALVYETFPNLIPPPQPKAIGIKNKKVEADEQ